MIRDKIIAMFSGKADSKGRTNLNYGRGLYAVEHATTNQGGTTGVQVDEGGQSPVITDQGFVEMATDLIGDTHIPREGQVMLPFVPHLYGKHNHGWAPPVYLPCQYDGDETTLPAYAGVIVRGVYQGGVGRCLQHTLPGEEAFLSDENELGDLVGYTFGSMGIVTAKLENDLWLVQVGGICYGYSHEVDDEDEDNPRSLAGRILFPTPGGFTLETASYPFGSVNLGLTGFHRSSSGDLYSQHLIMIGAAGGMGLPRFLSYNENHDDEDGWEEGLP